MIKILFTCDSIVGQFESLEDAKKARDAEGKLLFDSIYQHFFRQALLKGNTTLPAGKKFEVVVFRPYDFDLLSAEGVGHAKDWFMAEARKATIIFHHHRLFNNVRIFCRHGEEEAFDHITQFVDEQVLQRRLFHAKAEVIVSPDRPYVRPLPESREMFRKNCEDAGIPHPSHYSFDAMRSLFTSGSEISYPFVFKDGKGGVFLIEKRAQLATLFDGEKMELAKACYPQFDFSDLDLGFEPYIQTPSEYHSRYRLVFNGFGKKHVLSVLSYSEKKKTDRAGIEAPGTEISRIFRDADSPLFLSAGPSIKVVDPDYKRTVVLYPPSRTALTDASRAVVASHGIDITNPSVPAALLALATRAAEVFAEFGFIGLQGQDWIQGMDGRFSLINVFLSPASPIFRLAFAAGKGTLFEAALPAKAKAAADAIISTIKETP